jgi:hypothetical protein
MFRKTAVPAKFWGRRRAETYVVLQKLFGLSSKFVRGDVSAWR